MRILTRQLSRFLSSSSTLVKNDCMKIFFSYSINFHYDSVELEFQSQQSTDFIIMQFKLKAVVIDSYREIPVRCQSVSKKFRLLVTIHI